MILVTTVWLVCDAQMRKMRASSTWRETSVEMFLRTLSSGDLLLASGALWMQSLTRSHITHVALVYQCPETRQWSVWDTTRGRERGASLTPLHDFLFDWYSEGVQKERSGFAFGRNSVLWRCKLRSALQEPLFTAAIQSLRGKPYSMQLWKAFSTFVMPLAPPLPVLDSSEDHVQDEEGMYCSQLIARTLMDVGALSKSRPCSSYTPQQFWTLTDMPWVPAYTPPSEHERLLFPPGRLSLQTFQSMVLRCAGVPAPTVAQSAANLLRFLRSRIHVWLHNAPQN